SVRTDRLFLSEPRTVRNCRSAYHRAAASAIRNSRPSQTPLKCRIGTIFGQRIVNNRKDDHTNKKQARRLTRA
ncbi:MAG: hypothetical protein QOH35_1187, partial [Acidobacteriaceae bacterium]|nr:hypothetical protein [Acidobacteriaceae bacterium]